MKIIEEFRSVLDPIDRISEILFGLIMVLTFTGSISVASEGQAEVKELLLAAMGCNLAWGIVDAVMHLMNKLFERGHGLLVLKKLKSNTGKPAARSLISAELPPVIASIIKPEEIDQFRDRLSKIEDLPKSGLFTKADLRAAILIFILVSACIFPVSLPFIFFNDTEFALRSSNGIALLILFAGGYSVGKYSGFYPFRSGTVLMILGIVLVAITMALGG